MIEICELKADREGACPPFLLAVKGGSKLFFFEPTYVFDKITDVSAEFLKGEHIRGLLLDLDNTLTRHNDPVVPETSLKWIEDMKAAGIKLMIVSNNHAPRVEPFAAKLGLEFQCEGAKPLTIGYSRAMKRMGLDRFHVAAVGDQIFTDILGCSLKGIRSIFVFPIEPETSLPFRFKRMCERPFLPDVRC